VIVLKLMMQFFDLSTTVDPSYIISLIRKLLPLDSASVNRGSVTDSKEGDAPSVSKSKSENMDVDVSCESSDARGECQDTGDGIERSGVSVCEDVWEECGCVLWDLAASKTHAELMVLLYFCFLFCWILLFVHGEKC
jgi:hypothetical protein